MTQWERFATFVSSLNDNAAKNVEYKVLFMGRHGEGYHNAAESYFGTPAWNCYWALLKGNASVTWADAHLTEAGIEQALKANAFWLSHIQTQKIPLPQSYYVSPLSRCLETANYTFSGLPLPAKYPFLPTIKEKLRESISEHTCDHRSNKTYIHNMFPSWNFEPGFAEYDELWNGVTEETDAAQDFRSKQVLDDIFSNDCSTWLSFTSHSGEIGSILRVLKHRSFSLNTGAVIPVLVKAEKFSPWEATSTVSAPPWSTSAHCTTAPVTSISTGTAKGCICPKSAAPVTTALATFPTSA